MLAYRVYAGHVYTTLQLFILEYTNIPSIRFGYPDQLQDVDFLLMRAVSDAAQ